MCTQCSWLLKRTNKYLMLHVFYRKQIWKLAFSTLLLVFVGILTTAELFLIREATVFQAVLEFNISLITTGCLILSVRIYHSWRR